MARGWNVFAIGRRSHDEDQLTEMLAWLVARVPQVGHALIRLAFDDDFGVVEFTCTTQSGIEGGRLDALFTGSDFALVIESKIESDFGADQIERYLDWLEVVHGRRARRGLLTLTKRPLSTERLAELTARDGVAGSAHLWEELHERLGDLPEVDELQRVLVDEFLEMLEQEGLIPVKPFDPENELTSWHGASRTVDRFHTFFDACKPEIAEKLDASPVPNKKSAGPGHIWQEFQFSDGARLTVGLDCSSEGHPGRGGAGRWTPRFSGCSSLTPVVPTGLSWPVQWTRDRRLVGRARSAGSTIRGSGVLSTRRSAQARSTNSAYD
jgi:hypothetical protein